MAMLSIFICSLLLLHVVSAQTVLNDIVINGVSVPHLTLEECVNHKDDPKNTELIRMSSLLRTSAWTFPSTYTDQQHCRGVVLTWREFRENKFSAFPFEWHAAAPSNFTTTVQQTLRFVDTFFEPLHFKGVCGQQQVPFCFRMVVFDDTRPKTDFLAWVKGLDAQAQCFYAGRFPEALLNVKEAWFNKVQPHSASIRNNFLKFPQNDVALVQYLYWVLWPDYAIRFLKRVR